MNTFLIVFLAAIGGMIAGIVIMRIFYKDYVTVPQLIGLVLCLFSFVFAVSIFVADGEAYSYSEKRPYETTKENGKKYFNIRFGNGSHIVFDRNGNQILNEGMSDKDDIKFYYNGIDSTQIAHVYYTDKYFSMFKIKDDARMIEISTTPIVQYEEKNNKKVLIDKLKERFEESAKIEKTKS